MPDGIRRRDAFQQIAHTFADHLATRLGDTLLAAQDDGPSPADIIGVGPALRRTCGGGFEPTLDILLARDSISGRPDFVDDQFEGWPIRVRPVGRLECTREPGGEIRQAGLLAWPRATERRIRPIRPGVQTSHKEGKHGTVTCILTRKDREGHFILSAAHVICSTGFVARRGDPIYQPGYRGRDSANDVVAQWTASGSIKPGSDPGQANIDAAIAELTVPFRSHPQNVALQRQLGGVGWRQPVRKVGAKTGITKSIIEMPGFVRMFRPDGCTKVEYVDMIGVVNRDRARSKHLDRTMRKGERRPFAREGDSGALVFDNLGRPIGMVIEVTNSHCFVQQIGPVLDVFDAEICVND